MDQWLATIELRMEELGVDHLTIGAFIGRYNEAEPLERRRLRALGDRRLLRELRSTPAGDRSAAEASYSELVAQADDLLDAGAAVQSMLEWVNAGHDDVSTRAAIVFTAEQSRAQPRKTLLAALETVI